MDLSNKSEEVLTVVYQREIYYAGVDVSLVIFAHGRLQLKFAYGSSKHLHTFISQKGVVGAQIVLLTRW